MDPMPDVAVAIRLLTAGIFATAALGKMRHWRLFEGVVANYRLVPDAAVRLVSHVLPPVEAAIALAMLVPQSSRGAAVAAAALLLIFAGAMVVNLMRGRRHIDCGCFQNTLKQTLRWPLVVRNGLLAVLLIGIASRPPTPADPWSLLNGLLGGIALFIIWQSLNTLLSIVPAFKRKEMTWD